MALIRNQKPAANHWQLLRPAADGPEPDVPEGDVIVPLALWQARRGELLARAGRLGVWLSGEQDPAHIADDFEHFAVIAVDFAKFTNGRGYSVARLLRERYGWRGELRAIGDVQRDQVFYLKRCGFDAFDLRDSEDMQTALGAFNDFSEAYQASVDRPLPLFRRREVAGPRS